MTIDLPRIAPTRGGSRIEESRPVVSSESHDRTRSILLKWATNFFLVGFLMGLGRPGTLRAQQPSQRVYLTNIAEEDWRFLAGSKLRADFWDPVKYIPLGRKGWSVGFGGEMRVRADGFRVHGTQGTADLVDNYILQRYLLGTDLRMGQKLRFYCELQSGVISGRGDSPRPTDKDLFDVHQGFLEYRLLEGSQQSFQMRVGRQELTIGSSRLIAAAQGLNVKRSFDGLSLEYGFKAWRVQGAVARLVKLKPGFFNDPPDSGQDFWGASLARRGFPFKTTSVGAYYLGADRKLSEYFQGLGREQRHTLGARFVGALGKFDTSYDFIYQWGRFQNNIGVRAWAVATETGYKLGKANWMPRLGLSVNASSGDRDPTDNRLESFNPLFPGNTYSGLVGLLGPTNLADITPSMRFRVRQNLLLGVEGPSYFRRSTRDGIYGIDLSLLLPGDTNTEKYVGTNPGVVVNWQPARHITVTGAITRFLSGPFLTKTDFENGFSFYSGSLAYRF